MYEEKVRVEIKVNETQKPNFGEISVHHWDKKDRIKRSAKLGAMCLGVAAFCVLIPILHFVLVPSFLIAAPIVFMYFLGQENIISGGMGTCPSCEKPLPIVRAPYRFPLHELCTHCRKSLRIVIATQ